MKSASRALFLALLLCAGWADAANVTSYEDSLKAVCDHLIAQSNEDRPTEPCGDGSITDGCRANVEDILYEECEPDYGNESGCGCSGRRIGPAAVTRIAPGTYYQNDDVTDDLCLARHLWYVYQKEMKKNPGILKMYTGFPSGAHYSYPASNWKQKVTDQETNCCSNLEDVEECPGYDPRTRKWFYTAAVGSKNVVLLLDTSGSMWFKGSTIENWVSRIKLLKNTAHSVIDSLTHVDYLGIMTFRDGTQFWKDTLQPANEDNRKAAKEWVSAKIRNGGMMDFKTAFEETSQMLSRSKAQGSLTDCKTAILFFTDGKSDTSPWEAIEKLKQDYRSIMVVTYTLGSIADQGLARSIACTTSGFHQHIEDMGDLPAVMTNYWRLLAGGSGGEQETNKVLWGESYQDFLGLGEVIGPSLKCQAHGRLIAVAALTINKKRDPDTFKSDLKHRSTKCPYFNITESELAALRNHACPQVLGETRPSPTPGPTPSPTTLGPLSWILIFLAVLVLLVPCLAAAAVARGQRMYDEDEDLEGRKMAGEHNFTGQCGRFNVAVVSCPGGPDRWRGLGQGEMFADLIGMEGLAVSVVFVKDEGVDVFWQCYREALHHAVGKKFVVVVTKHNGSIGNMQRQEVLLLDSCCGEDGLPNFHQDDVHLVAMTFKEFKAWSREEFRELDLGCRLRRDDKNPHVKRLPSIAEMEARFRRLPRTPRRRPVFRLRR